MGAPPAILECLALHAASNPGRIAVEHFGTPIGWRKFYEDSRRFAYALEQLGVREGQVVAVAHPNNYVHWLLLIALEALGAVSASFSVSEETEGLPLQDLLDRCDLVLSHPPLAAKGGFRQHVLSDDWLGPVMALPDPLSLAHPALPYDAGGKLRLNRSSGTTGRAKLMMMTGGMQEYWIGHAQEIEHYAQTSRLLLAYPFTVNAAYCRAVACLRQGGLTIFADTRQGLAAGQVTHLWLLPGLLDGILKTLPADFTPLPDLRLTTGGAAVSPELRARTQQKLGCEILSGYGANEAGSAICRIEPDGTGRPYPGVGLRIVDESGRGVAEGETGVIELRTPGLVAGYVGHEEATAKAFHDGWFNSGDLAQSLDQGRFRLIGRVDDMMNFGGVKIAPQPLEEQILKAVPALLEVAVVSLSDPGGFERMCIAAVLKPGAKLATIVDGVAWIIPKQAGEVTMKAVPALPKTPNGKLSRQDVRHLFSPAAPPR